MIASAVGFDPEQSQFADGKITNGTRSATLHEATAGGRLTAEESIEFGTLSKEYQQSTFAGHFVEVGVHSARSSGPAYARCVCCRTHPESENCAQPGHWRNDYGYGRGTDGGAGGG